ncbi:hypothetical protein D3C75_1015360 [compost metagenome]
MIIGRITLVRTFSLLAPRSRAASVSVGLISCRCGRIISTAIGTLNATWESSTEVKPSLMPAMVNRIRKEAPIITSGLTISTLFSESSAFFDRRLRLRWMASAPMTASSVAIAEDRSAITSVLITIMIRRVSCRTSR